MKIIIENVVFPFEFGCKVLKLKHEDCPYAELDGVWQDIVPATFGEIAMLENIEQRRVGILCLGIERIVASVKPKLIDTRTIEKTHRHKGVVGVSRYMDTYELYKVDGEVFGKNRFGYGTMDDSYYVKFKDTSTDREYMIWIDLKSVCSTKHGYYDGGIDGLSAIDCIAWTIQTNVPKGNVGAIVRQGDCVFVRPKDSGVPLLDMARHLTGEEYLELMVAES